MPDFRRRLNRTQQRVYDRSNAVTSIPLRITPRMRTAVRFLERTLVVADRARTERVVQVLCDEICAALAVPRLRAIVRGVRPSDRRGELHGLYTAGADGRHRIELWMATAKRRQVVAFKTFLRTLLHEVCHHLDYHLLRLADSFHTDGFFKRESSLFHQLFPLAASPPSEPRTGVVEQGEPAGGGHAGGQRRVAPDENSI